MAMNIVVGVTLLAAPVALGASFIARLQAAAAKEVVPLDDRPDRRNVAVGTTCEWYIVSSLRSEGIEDLLPSFVALLAAAENVSCVSKHIQSPPCSAHGNDGTILIFHKPHSCAAVGTHRIRGASHHGEYNNVILLTLESIDRSDGPLLIQEPEHIIVMDLPLDNLDLGAVVCQNSYLAGLDVLHHQMMNEANNHLCFLEVGI